MLSPPRVLFLSVALTPSPPLFILHQWDVVYFNLKFA